MTLKHATKEEQAERHDHMIQRRAPAAVGDLPRVPMFPGVAEGGTWEGDPEAAEDVASQDTSAHERTPAPTSAHERPRADTGLQWKTERGLRIPVFRTDAQKPAEAARERKPAKAKPAPSKAAQEPAAAVRWALWSDGGLDIRGPDGWVNLTPADVQRLREYLTRMEGAG